MYLRITEIGDISQKHRHNSSVSDIMIFIQSMKTFKTGEDVLESHLTSLKQSGFFKWTIGTDTEIIKNNLTKYLGLLGKKEIVLCITGNNQDDFGQSENSLFNSIQSFIDDILTVFFDGDGDKKEKIELKLICGGQHGPEIMAGKIFYQKKLNVEVYTTYKYRVRLNGVEYESTAKKMEDYIKS